MIPIRIQKYILIPASVLSGAAGALAMPGYGFWPLLCLSLSCLYIIIYCESSKTRAFFSGWAFGFGYHLVGLSWIGNALLIEGNPFRWAYPLALTGPPLILGLYTALGAWAVKYRNLRTWQGFLFFVCVFALIDWLRGHLFTGFPWNLYAYSWAGQAEIIQSVSVFGIYGLNLLTIAFFSFPGRIAVNIINGSQKARSAELWVTSASICVLIITVYIFGSYRLQSHPVQSSHDTYVVVVQPNIAQSDKWHPDKLKENFLAHNRLTQKAASDNKKYQRSYVIWPESALNPVLLNSQVVSELLQETLSKYPGSSYLISGALRRNKTGNDVEHYNSIIVMNENGEIKSVYNKHHLVPFGEYIPLSKIIDIAPIVGFSGFIEGQTPESILLEKESRSFIPLICYEAIFPWISRKAALRKYNSNNELSMIINVTNDAWYGPTAGPVQHFHQTRFRAIESGLPVIRSANTGISAIIDPYGRVIKKQAFNTSGTLKADLPLKTGGTIYHQFGDLPFLLLSVLAALVSLILAKVQYKKPRL